MLLAAHHFTRASLSSLGSGISIECLDLFSAGLGIVGIVFGNVAFDDSVLLA